MALLNGGFLHYMDMKKFLKNLLLWNHWSDFEIILQECSLGDPFQKMFAKFWSAQKHGSDEWELLALYRDMKKFLKNLLLRNCRSDFEIMSQECSLGDPFQKVFAKFWSLHKHGYGEWGFLALYGGFLHYTDMKKFMSVLCKKILFSETTGQILKLFHRNQLLTWADVLIARFRDVIATGKVPWPFVSPPGK